MSETSKVGNKPNNYGTNRHNADEALQGQTLPGMGGNTHVVPPMLSNSAARENLSGET